MITADTIISFGKYKNHKASKIAFHDPQYIIWLHEKTDWLVDESLLKEAKSIIEKIKECNRELEWERVSEEADRKSREDNLKNAIDTDYGRAVKTSDGNFRLIDDEGNESSDTVSWYFGWSEGNWQENN